MFNEFSKIKTKCKLYYLHKKLLCRMKKNGFLRPQFFCSSKFVDKSTTKREI